MDSLFQERQKVIEIDGDFFKIDLIDVSSPLTFDGAIELKKVNLNPQIKVKLNYTLDGLKNMKCNPAKIHL